MVSECTFHPLSEQFPVGLMMRPKNVGVAHLRAFSVHGGHQGGTGGSKGKTLHAMSQDTNTHYRFTRVVFFGPSYSSGKAQSTRTVDAPLTQMDGRHVFNAVSGTDTWTLRERSEAPSQVKEQVSHSSETRKLSMFLTRRSKSFRKDILLSESMSNS